MRVAEVVVPAVVMAALGGVRGALYLLCAGVVHVRRWGQLRRLRRTVLRQLATPGLPMPTGELMRLMELLDTRSVMRHRFTS